MLTIIVRVEGHLSRRLYRCFQIILYPLDSFAYFSSARQEINDPVQAT